MGRTWQPVGVTAMATAVSLQGSGIGPSCQQLTAFWGLV